jgi:hypothetical protein
MYLEDLQSQPAPTNDRPCLAGGFAVLNSICKMFLAVVAAAAAVPALAQAPQYTPPPVTVTNVLDTVHYDYKWELTAGPQLVQNAGLGGFDIQAARFFNKKWAIDLNARGYYGTTGVEPNDYLIRGPFVMEHWGVAGPEYRMVANKHAAVTLHALAGAVYGDFQRATQGPNGQSLTPREVNFSLGMYANQFAFASAMGGSLDLNRSGRLAFRISPDALLTRYTLPGAQNGIDAQFGFSVGVLYRLDKIGGHARHRKRH